MRHFHLRHPREAQALTQDGTLAHDGVTMERGLKTRQRSTMGQLFSINSIVNSIVKAVSNGIGRHQTTPGQSAETRING